MLKLEPTSRTLEAVSSTTLAEAKILERGDLQAAILRSWDAFCAELGFEELFLVGAEIVPHESCNVRIDILALGSDGKPVIFELKRHHERLQLLQALSYAAMVARWDAQRFLRELGTRHDDEADELRSLLNDESFQLTDPRVVLIAGAFDPEVVLAADWLAKFGVPILAFAVATIEYRGDTLISIDQKFPLAGIDDVYVRRASRTASDDEIAGWEDALKDIEFPFARRALNVFRRRIEGSPQRRSFFSIYGGSPLGRMRITFRHQYLKIYTGDQSPEAERVLRERLGSGISISRWGSETTKHSGFTFKIETETEFEQFLSAVGDDEARQSATVDAATRRG
jgi:hypothetical protein